MEKLTNLDHLRAASLAAKGLIGEVAEATAAALEELAAQQQGGIPAAGGGIPSGLVAMWSGAADAVPDGWALCDGENGTPDLRDRFVLGAGTTHSVGDTGGSEEVTLTVEQMPSHAHTYYGGWSSSIRQGTSGAADVIISGSNKTIPTGSSQPHPNMPPYYTLCYIMKL